MTGNAANWFVDRHIAEGRGAKTAFEEAWEGGRQLTYGALAEGAGQVAEQVGIATPVVGARWRIQSWRIWPYRRRILPECLARIILGQRSAKGFYWP